MERRNFIMTISLGAGGLLAGRKSFAVSNNNLIDSAMETATPVVNKLMMLSLNVSDIPKSKAFYSDKLGLRIASEYRLDDNNWWVTLTFPDGGANITLARSGAYPENIKAGTIALYFEASDISAVHKELRSRGLKIDDIQNDLFGPGSGVKFFRLDDPDGNLIHVAEAHAPRVPF